MRSLLFTALLLATLVGCIHLPPEVAAVVREADPPGHNHFLPEPPVEQTAARGMPDDP